MGSGRDWAAGGLAYVGRSESAAFSGRLETTRPAPSNQPKAKPRSKRGHDMRIAIFYPSHADK